MIDYAVINPVTGETVATYPTATDADIQEAIALAYSGFQTWRDTSVDDRAQALRRSAELYRERREELANIIVREMGKRKVQALEEVDFTADITDYYADNAHQILEDQPINVAGEGTAMIRRSPLGVLLGIMPWNLPYYQLARFVAPNLLIGNTIILKHAPQCPESSAAIEQLHLDAGMPPGVYVNVYATNEQAADIVADPRVEGVSVTGSERAGMAVATNAGKHLKKVALELGGSDPFILFSTDDMDATVKDAVDARLDNNGQVCNAPKRFIIVEELYDEFMAKFTEAMKNAPMGDPMDPNVELGPLATEAAAKGLEEQINRAVEQGARLLIGGKRDGAFYQATILTDVTRDMDIWEQELFGPAAVVHRVGNEDEAIALANDVHFGLGSYVYTTDQEQARRVADKIEAGMVWVNLVLGDSPELPFGGVKRSGTSRELGLLAAEEFVNKKLIRIV